MLDVMDVKKVILLFCWAVSLHHARHKSSIKKLPSMFNTQNPAVVSFPWCRAAVSSCQHVLGKTQPSPVLSN